jgi:hypothetical protein
MHQWIGRFVARRFSVLGSNFFKQHLCQLLLKLGGNKLE